jgi:acyl-CoA thioesterase-1
LAPDYLVSRRNQDLPSVLLIGDSISIGYTPFVQELLRSKANVYRPLSNDGNPVNCSGTSKGITDINFWIGNKRWDVIHFNFGLHDIKHEDPETGEASSNPKDPLQADLKQYKKNMKLIVNELLSTGAKLIFATTTPVPSRSVSPLREPENVLRYNKAALKIIKKGNIAVNDLYTFALPKLKEIQIPDNVHYTEDGSRALAVEVTNKIMECL